MPLGEITEFRRLGSSDLEVSRVGFGGWAIGGHAWGVVDDEQSIRAVRKALDLGITLFDTADVYGFGHSEEILAKALGERRKSVVIATKFGVRWNESGQTIRDMSPGYVVRALEASLRRLKLDTIPLYQMHWPDPKTPIEATLAALKVCQEQGKIRYIGCSNFPAEMVRRVHELGCLQSIQAPYNLIDREIEKDLLPCSAELRIGLIAYNPLAQGLLSGKFDSTARFGANDVRSRSKYFQDVCFEKNLNAVARLREAARACGRSLSQVALRWILENPAVSSVIPGIKTPEQAVENAGAMGWSLDRDLYETLAAHGEV